MARVTYKACRECRYLVETKAERCPNCGSTDFTKLWRGYIIVVDPEGSAVAKKIDAKIPGAYAIKMAR
ncbi:TPA: DNA-directed RNA polymerase, subunit E'' [Candidatus Micrarchaeota archaeon]|nr:DNA-directed RNA polymerase, subunit E'' [Candidatus Micrarchaeota archaeon]